MNEPKPMNEHCRLEHGDWNYLERSEDELCPVCRGEQMATERIIKLLEAKDENLIGEISDWFEYGLEHQAGRAARSRVIALIKGEESNNEEFSGTSISNHVAKQRRTIRRYP